MPRLQGPPLAVLASAYGIPEDDPGAVAAAIYERLFGPTHVTISADLQDRLPAEWTAIATIVGMLVLDRQGFARARGGGKPPKPLRKSMAKMTACYVDPPAAPEFVDRVLAEIASTLAADRKD